LAVGESASLGGYSFTYLSFDFDQFSDRDEFIAKFDVWSEEDHIGIIQSTRSFYSGFKISSTRAGIRSNLLEDFYIVPSEFQADGQAVFRVYISPLVWWMWASGPLLVLGVLIAISPRRKPKSSFESVVASGNLHRT
jgi:cytochrome c-type biogenesis protein CcmF